MPARTVILISAAVGLLGSAGCVEPSDGNSPAPPRLIGGAVPSTESGGTPEVLSPVAAGVVDYIVSQGPSSPTAQALNGVGGCPIDPDTGLVDRACVAALYISLVRNAPDSDGDGVPDPIDNTLGPDTDQDGIPNEVDPDVDGDTIPNKFDLDVDGDGQPNFLDLDIDDDGVPNGPDPDADGDGLSDRWDLNDDGDSLFDDEDPDDDGGGDDPPSDKLLDLVGRLRTGNITDRERNTIATEIVERLDNDEAKARVLTILTEIVRLAVDPTREPPPGPTPRGVWAVDAVYRQLADAVDAVRAAEADPSKPLPNEKLGVALNNFLSRGDALVKLSRKFPNLDVSAVGDSTADLAEVFQADRLDRLVADFGDHVDPDAIGLPGTEKLELRSLVKGATGLGSAFTDDEPESILDVVDRLRERAKQIGPDPEQREQEYTRLLDRMKQIRTDSPDASVDEAADQVESEEDGGGSP